MKRYRLRDSGDRGWYIGDFDRAIFRTSNFEVSYQFNPAGDVSEKHYHKIATEINLIANGRCIINGEVFQTGDIIQIDPGELLEAHYLEDTYTVCVKTPSVPQDKYLV